MTRIALLAFVLTAGCTGTYYPYSGSGPAYATAQTQQVAQSQDGTTTTTTTTSQSYAFEPAAQPAAYASEPPQAPPEPPPAEEPAPPPLCHPRDTANMCVALTVIVDVGDIIAAAQNGSCRDASKSLNRYADSHAREIETLIRLRELEPKHKLAKWEERHRSRAEGVMTAALDLDTRCEHNEKLDRALRRVGFTGLIGSPAL
jgi:hypothetical protein